MERESARLSPPGRALHITNHYFQCQNKNKLSVEPNLSTKLNKQADSGPAIRNEEQKENNLKSKIN